MFVVVRAADRRSRTTLAVSVAAHLALLAAVVMHRAKPIEVVPTSLALGNGKHSYGEIYLANSAPALYAFRKAEEILQAPPRKAEKKVKPAPQPERERRARVAGTVDKVAGDSLEESARAGSPYGSSLQGPISGSDVRPAIPIVYPSPEISSSELGGAKGKVIVEVTIDEQGNVVETRLLQGLMRVIDEAVVATVRRWRFRPATVDGRPVASKHDVHFPFPA